MEIMNVLQVSLRAVLIEAIDAMLAQWLTQNIFHSSLHVLFF